MWYKTSPDAITFKAPLDQKDSNVFHLLKIGDITQVSSASLNIKNKYIGILTDFFRSYY